MIFMLSACDSGSSAALTCEKYYPYIVDESVTYEITDTFELNGTYNLKRTSRSQFDISWEHNKGSETYSLITEDDGWCVGINFERYDNPVFEMLIKDALIYQTSVATKDYVNNVESYTASTTQERSEMLCEEGVYNPAQWASEMDVCSNNASSPFEYTFVREIANKVEDEKHQASRLQYLSFSVDELPFFTLTLLDWQYPE